MMSDQQASVTGAASSLGLSEMGAAEMLSFLAQSGTINLDGVAAAMKKAEEERILREHHPYKIFKGSDGRWKTYIRDETKKRRKRLVTAKTEEKLRETLVGLYLGEDITTQNRQMTLEDFYPTWKTYKSLHTKAENYIQRIDRDWKKYYADTEIVKVPLQRLTKLQLDEWAHCLIKNYDMTNKQYYNATVIMRQALDHAVELGVIERNLFSMVKIDGRRLFRHEKKKASSTQVFSDQEVRSIEELVWADTENSVHSRIHKLAPLGVLFMLKTGIRVGEMLAVRYEDITEDGKWIHIQRMYRYETKEVVEHTKGLEGDRIVPLPETARKVIAFAKAKQRELGCPDDGYIFSINTLPLPYQPVQYLYEKYCKKIGTSRKSSHKARKTYISALIDNGVNLNSIREIVGHADEQTTLHNYCFDRSSEEERLAMIEKAISV